MENTEKFWIIYVLLLSLNYLIAEKITTDKRNAAGLIQFIYFKNALTPKFEPKDKLLGKRISIFFPQKMKSYGFFADLHGLIKPDTLKQLPRRSNIQSSWDKALQTTAKISASSLEPHDSAPYQQEVVWKERRPDSQILFIMFVFV